MLDSLKPDGTAILAIRTPPDVMEALPNSSRRPPPHRGSAVQALTAVREAQYYLNATLAGQQVNLPTDLTLARAIRAGEART